MFEKLQRAFWKALTPDLIAETVTAPKQSLLSAEVLNALGGADNLKSQQRVALTRASGQRPSPATEPACSSAVAPQFSKIITCLEV